MAGMTTLHGADGRLNFVSCPIVRDTSTVPCWLAEYEGELYYLTIQSDVSAPVTPPWLGHRVLVEGTVTKAERICGGVVLSPVRLSVLPERDASCNTMLPAEAKYDLTFEPPRPPGPSKGRLAFAGPAAPAGPGVTAAPGATTAPAAPAAARGSRAPAAAAGDREIVIQYDFDGLVGFSHAGVLSQALEAARQAKAQTIEIVGYRGAVLLSNGQRMLEDAAMGQRRAEQVANLLRGAGLTSPAYKVTWTDQTAGVTGTDDHLTRRVVITVRR
jgi:outer membrane protein OmpA-like peptidoglycan-associated protein